MLEDRVVTAKKLAEGEGCGPEGFVAEVLPDDQLTGLGLLEGWITGLHHDGDASHRSRLPAGTIGDDEVGTLSRTVRLEDLGDGQDGLRCHGLLRHSRRLLVEGVWKQESRKLLWLEDLLPAVEVLLLLVY